MAQTIKIKRSSQTGNKLTASNSVAGELGLNTADKALYIQTGSTDASVVTVYDDSILHLDDTNNRVGIGTTSPAYPFDVNVAGGNTVNFTSTDNRMQIRIKDNDTTGYVGVENSVFYLGLNAGIGTNNLSIKSDGAVGIGTTAPNRQLHISGSGATVAAKVEATDGSQSSIDLKNSEGEFRIISDGGELSIYDQTDTTERFRIDTAGFVGINTSNPQVRLHITTDTGGHESNDEASILLEDTATEAGEPSIAFKNSASGSSRWHIGLNQDNELHFNYGTTSFSDANTKVNILANGRVGILRITPSQTLDIGGNVGISGTEVIDSSGNWVGPSSGLKGEPGAKGQKGEVGSAGADGADGGAGSTGAKGEVGVKGQKGEVGADGGAGTDGAKGQKGEAGSAGAKGQKGEVGDTGAKGQKGEQAGITAIASFADNRVITASSTTALQGEANLTFDNTTLSSPILYPSGGQHDFTNEVGTDPTNVAIIINKDDFIYNNNDGYARKMIGLTSGQDIEIGQSGTALIRDIILTTGTSGNIFFKTNNGTTKAKIDNSGKVYGEMFVANINNDTVQTGHASFRRGSLGEAHIDAPGHVHINIDTNNNNTDRYFSIRKDATTTDLFKVKENGNVEITGAINEGTNGWLNFNDDQDSHWPLDTDNLTVLGSITHMVFAGDSNANGTGGEFYWGYGQSQAASSQSWTTTAKLERSGIFDAKGGLKINGSGVINSSGEWTGSSSGLKGEPGDKGATGAKGDTGAKGQKGEVGQKGDTGAKGEVGQKGAAGAKGQKGEIGQKGDTGAKGQKGEQAGITAISNFANDRVVTASSSTALVGESNLTFNSSALAAYTNKIVGRGAGTTSSGTILSQVIPDHSIENNGVVDYAHHNLLAGADQRYTVTATLNGSSFTPSSKWFKDPSSNGGNHVFSSATSELVILIEDIPNTQYTARVGIVFGNAGWRTRGVKIETFRNGAWQTECDLTNNAENMVTRQVSANNHNGVTKVKYTLKDPANTGGMYTRINMLFMLNYQTSASDHGYYVNKYANSTIPDGNKVQFGDDNDLQIYHDGNNSRIHDTGTGNLILRGTNLSLQDSSGFDYVTAVDNGDGGTVRLFYNNSERLKTTSTGVDVTGTVTSDGLTVDGSTDLNGSATISGTLSFDGTAVYNALHLNNNNIIGVNNMVISDAGASEGVQWQNWHLYESPDDLSNATGNFQIVKIGTGAGRKFTVSTTGIDVVGSVEISGTEVIDSSGNWTGPVAGFKGEVGEKGATGAKGQKGEVGQKGQKGEVGSKGSTGATGTGVTMEGQVATTSNLPSSGNTKGDAYIVQADDSLHIWDGSAWVSGGSIQGPQGSKGQKGEVGAKGEVGQKGATGQKGEVGQKGDTGQKGQGGTNGTNGTNGNDGAKGATGAKGAPGAQGQKGEVGQKGAGGAGGAKGQKGEQAGITAIASFSNNRVLTASSSTAINGEANLTFNGTDLTVLGSGRVIADHFVFTDYGGPALQMNDSSFSNAPTHDVLYTAYQTNLGDYITLKAPGNSSTSAHGIIGIADNGIFFGASNIETGTTQMSNSADTPFDGANYGHIDSAGMDIKGLTLATGDGGTNGVINVKASVNGYFQQNGNTRLTINSSGITSSSKILTADGSQSSPTHTFTGDTDTGMYSSSANILEFSTGGTRRAYFNDAGIHSEYNLYTAANGMFRNYGGVWTATTGLTGNGFSFANSVDGTAMTISSTGDVVCTGSLSATTKSFDIEHPTKEGMRLHHGSLEGPEHGVYIRGRNKGTVIELPEYWLGLVDESTITVQLTAIGEPQNLCVADIKDNKVYVKGVEYFYFIQAERKDIEKFEVEYEI